MKFLCGKVDLNKGDYDKRTPLHLASAEGHLVDIVRFLLENNVTVNPKDRWGNTPLHEVHINTQDNLDSGQYMEIKSLLERGLI